MEDDINCSSEIKALQAAEPVEYTLDCLDDGHVCYLFIFGGVVGGCAVGSCIPLDVVYMTTNLYSLCVCVFLKIKLAYCQRSNWTERCQDRFYKEIRIQASSGSAVFHK